MTTVNDIISDDSWSTSRIHLRTCVIYTLHKGHSSGIRSFQDLFADLFADNSTFDYAITIWGSAATSLLNDLQDIQSKAFARLLKQKDLEEKIPS